MRSMGDSDHMAEDPDPASGFRPSSKQVLGAVVAVVLVILIAANSGPTSVSLVVTSVTMPLWLILTITALLGMGIGMLLGSRRARARLRN
ncbi:MAG: LapA family protein [Microthrixaceae bacterium]|nr:LapA family protein [Microthrixaceae bacterium]